MEEKIILRMSEKEFLALIEMAEENASMIGCSGDGSIIGDEFFKINTKRVKVINKMLKKNGINRNITY